MDLEATFEGIFHDVTKEIAAYHWPLSLAQCHALVQFIFSLHKWLPTAHYRVRVSLCRSGYFDTAASYHSVAVVITEIAPPSGAGKEGVEHE